MEECYWKEIKEHVSTEAHMMSMVRWNTYSKKAPQAAFDTSDIQGKQHERQRQRNREILTYMIDITVYLAQQGQAFRGVNESVSSANQGNFVASRKNKPS